MNRFAKWVVFGLGGLAGLLLLVFLVLYTLSTVRINKRYDVAAEAIGVPSDAEILARGQHLADIFSCTECHGETLAGGPFLEDPMLGKLYADNLTGGDGGIGPRYSDADYVRLIRHGVNPEGKSVLYMPVQDMNHIGDGDLGALIAYLRTLPPVDNTLPDNTIGPLGRVLLVAGKLPLLPAELIDHDTSFALSPEPGVTIDYGAYLARGCQGCHGHDFGGGPIPGAPPDAPPTTDLTPAGSLAGWSEDDFIATMRTGVTPDGRHLDGQWMPWPTTAKMTDDELKAVWLYLQSLPPHEEIGSG